MGVVTSHEDPYEYADTHLLPTADQLSPGDTIAIDRSTIWGNPPKVPTKTISGGQSIRSIAVIWKIYPRGTAYNSNRSTSRSELDRSGEAARGQTMTGTSGEGKRGRLVWELVLEDGQSERVL